MAISPEELQSVQAAQSSGASATQVSNMEFQAQQMFVNSLSQTGQVPNPQFVSESLATGATPDLTSAYGDPVVSPYLAAGSPGFGNAPPAAQLGPNGGAPDPMSYDPNQNAQWSQQQIKSNPQYQQYAALGQVPVPSTGYVNDVRGGSVTQVQKYQNFLATTGFLAPSHQNNGYWDEDTDNAFLAYMTNLYMPQALFGKDTATQSQASQFLSSLQSAYNPNFSADPKGLQQLAYNNPDFLTQLASGWVATQGTQDPKKALNDYADQFGQQALPQPLQKLADPGFLQTAEDTGWSLAGMVPGLLSIVTSPLSGGKIDPGKWWSQHGPQAAEVNDITTALKSSGVQQQNVNALMPILNQAQNDTGWLPFDVIDQKWDQAILATLYTTQEAFSNHKDANWNPFDPTSPTGQKIAAYSNNLGAGIFGQQWATDHPTEDSLFNFTADFADPFYFIGGPLGFARLQSLGIDLGATAAKAGASAVGDIASQLPKVGDIVKGAKVSSVSTADVLSNGVKTSITKYLDPVGTMQKSLADGLMQVKDVDEHGLRSILGLTDQTPSDMQDLANAGKEDPRIQALQAVKDAKTPQEVLAVLQKDFPHVFTPSGLHNARTALRSLTPNVIARLGGGVLSKIRTFWGMPMIDSNIDHASDFGSANKLQTMFHVAGVDEPTINSVLNEWYKSSPTERGDMLYQGGSAYTALDKAILIKDGKLKVNASDADYKKVAGQGMASAGKTWSNILNGSKIVVPQQVTDHVAKSGGVQRSMYGSTPTATGHLGSSMVSRLTDDEKAQLSTVREMQSHVTQLWQENLTQEGQLIMAKDPNIKTWQEAIAAHEQSPAGAALKNEYDTRMAYLKQQEEQIVGTGEQRPMGITSSALRQSTDMPFNSYSLMVHMNKGSLGTATYERLASRFKADYFYSKWKQLALLQPSTIARLAMGDDLMRPAIEMAMNGHPVQGMKIAAKAAAKGFRGAGSSLKNAAITSAVGKKIAKASTVEKAQEHIQAQNISHLTQRDWYSLSKVMGEWDPSFYQEFEPTGPNASPAYPEAYAHNIRMLAQSPEVVAYAKAAIKRGGAGTSDGIAAAKAWYEQATPAAQELLDKHGVDQQTMAQKLSDFMEMIAPTKQQKQWIINGNIDPQKLRSMINNMPEKFTPVAAPRLTLEARNHALSMLKAPINLIFHDVMEPFVNNARASIGESMRGVMEKNLRALTAGNPSWDEARIKATASSQLNDWMQNNLYQGQRSIAGTALRHVFPFYGATANMSKFFFRQWAMHPLQSGTQEHLLSGLEAQSNNQQQSGKTPGMNIGGGILTALGFSGGDALSVDPARAMFFTNDGFASFVPGFGPVMSPLLDAVGGDAQLNAIIQDIPGLREEMSYHQPGSEGSPLFSYLTNITSGIGLMSPLHQALTVPVIGRSDQYYQNQLDEKFQQMAADNQQKGLPPPSQEDVENELGKEILAGQVGATILPFGSKVVDTTREAANAATNAFGAATTDSQRDAVIAANPQMAPLLQYLDPRTAPQARDAIAENPQTAWVVPYTVSRYSTNGNKPIGLAGFQEALSNGDINVMSLNNYSQSVATQWETTNFWTAYDTQVNGPKQAFLAQTGLTTSSPEYKTFNDEILQPRLEQLANNYPTAYQQFLTDETQPTDLAGLQAKATPLNAVTTWDVIPHYGTLENDRSQMWRKAIVWRDQASNEINALKSQSAPKVETDLVQQTLQQNLQQLAAQYPQYASELQAYDTSHWQDVVNYDALLEKDYPGYVVSG